MPSRVLVISHDYVRKSMAGPAIRAFELARQVHAAGHQVTLAVPISTDLDAPPFQLATYHPQEPETLRALATGVDVVVVQGWVLEHNPYLRETAAALVVDVYDPFPLEYLATVKVDATAGAVTTWPDVLGTLVEQLRLGDFFLCASERQRDFWTGALLALNRVTAATYDGDPTLRSLIDVVPFGIPDQPAIRTGPGLREALGIGPQEVVLLWGGGIYNWFDPLTLIRAVARLASTRKHVRLVFLSASHPNPDVPQMAMLASARALARELGVDGGAVIFNESWVPYQERANWLLDADVGVSTHLDHAETRFSFRTRILDYFWAGLPVVCTRGDSLADLIEREDLGLTVPPEDVDATERALAALVDDAAGRRRRSQRVAEVAGGMTWQAAARPLVEFCAHPRAAGDRAGLGRGQAVAIPLRTDAERHRRLDPPVPPPLWRRGLRTLRREGPAGLVRAVRRRYP